MKIKIEDEYGGFVIEIIAENEDDFYFLGKLPKKRFRFCDHEPTHRDLVDVFRTLGHYRIDYEEVC